MNPTDTTATAGSRFFRKQALALAVETGEILRARDQWQRELEAARSERASRFGTDAATKSTASASPAERHLIARINKASDACEVLSKGVDDNTAKIKELILSDGAEVAAALKPREEAIRAEVDADFRRLHELATELVAVTWRVGSPSRNSYLSPSRARIAGAVMRAVRNAFGNSVDDMLNFCPLCITPNGQSTVDHALENSDDPAVLAFFRHPADREDDGTHFDRLREMKGRIAKLTDPGTAEALAQDMLRLVSHSAEADEARGEVEGDEADANPEHIQETDGTETAQATAEKLRTLYDLHVESEDEE